MLKNLKEFYYPTKIAEAVSLLDKLGARGAPIAGGTSLARVVNPTIESLVDVTRLGLSYIKEDKDGIRLGAATPFQAIVESKAVQSFAGGLLSKVAANVSTRLVRNIGTIGGNIVLAYPYNGFPPALLALEASVVMATKKGTITVLLSEMMDEHPWRYVAKRHALVTEIRLPKKAKSWGSSYQRFVRTHSEWEASVIVAATVDRDGKTCTSVRLAVGAVTRRAQLFPEVEKTLTGQVLTPALAVESARKVVENLDFVTDWRASKEHRIEVTKVLTVRALNEAYTAAGR